MSFTHSSSSSFKKPEHSTPVPISNKANETKKARNEKLKKIKNNIRAKAVQAFKNWILSRKKVSTLENQKLTNELEKKFRKIDPISAPKTIKRHKENNPTIVEIVNKAILNKEKKEKKKQYMEERRIIREGLTIPRPKKPILTNAQKQTLRNKGILGLKEGGTRRKR